LACEAFFNEYHITPTITHEHEFSIYKNHEKTITILQGDFFKLSKKNVGNLDLVYDRAALIAMPPAMRQPYIEKLITLMDLHTKILLITTYFESNQMQGPPFSLGQADIQHLYGPRFNINQIFNQPIKTIAEHLKTRGLKQAWEQAYAINCNWH
jgi:thiopurine S-methyltransferase